MGYPQPIVSVVMAAYNEEEYIDEAIDSILQQTLESFEFIIINDGSTDATAEILDSYQDNRLVILSNDVNQGLAASLNRGIRNANGEFIARMDADDLSHPSRIERQVERIQSNPESVVVGSRSQIIDRNGEPLTTVSAPDSTVIDREFLLSDGPIIPHGSALIMRNALEEVGGYRSPFRLAQDFDLWLRMAETFGRGFMEVLDSVLYDRRVDWGQIGRRPRQRYYERYVRKAAERRASEGTDQEIINELTGDRAEPETIVPSDSRKQAWYLYHLGEWMYSESKLQCARRYFAQACRTDPFYLKAWILLIMSVLPDSVRSRLSKS